MSELQSAVTGLIGEGMSMKDLLSEVKSICKDIKEQEKKQKKDKTGSTKPPNAYQLFVKEQMKAMKDSGSSLTGKDLMKEIGNLWQQKKGSLPSVDDEPEPEPVTPPQSPLPVKSKPSVPPSAKGGFGFKAFTVKDEKKSGGGKKAAKN